MNELVKGEFEEEQYLELGIKQYKFTANNGDTFYSSESEHTVEDIEAFNLEINGQ